MINSRQAPGSGEDITLPGSFCPTIHKRNQRRSLCRRLRPDSTIQSLKVVATEAIDRILKQTNPSRSYQVDYS